MSVKNVSQSIVRVKEEKNVPNPSAHNETIVSINLNNRVVNNDSKVESLDLGVARGRFADVEQAKFAGFAALGDARGQAVGGAGVRAVDDEGFVREFCKIPLVVC
jgi:hypothetical protein